MEHQIMSWHCINVADADAIDLIAVLERGYAEAGKAPDVEVFHRRRGDGSHVFYLSPIASVLFGEVLVATGAVICKEPGADDKRVRVRL